MKDKNLDNELGNLIKQSFQEVKMDDAFKERLFEMKASVKPLSPLERFLEKEISIPVSSISAAASVMLIAGGVLLNSLLLPGEIPQPKYEIIEMRLSEVQGQNNDIS